MKDKLEYVVERKRNAELEAVAMLIKKRIMGYLQRKKYLKIRNDIITIQKNYKVLTHMLLFFSVFFIFCPLLCALTIRDLFIYGLHQSVYNFFLGTLLLQTIPEETLGSDYYSEG